MTEQIKTEGQYRVGTEFNPSKDLLVGFLKNRCAELIDFILEKGRDKRTAALAATAFEEGAMWAVKSLTKPVKEAPGGGPA